MQAAAWGVMKNAVCLDFSKAIKEQGKEKIDEKYKNLFTMYEKITGMNAYAQPMLISPRRHFTMGGLWVDYELMTTIPDCLLWAKQTLPTTGLTG
jgi:succinate dehydrogenase / fumarate reductase flavoprotein subunit